MTSAVLRSQRYIIPVFKTLIRRKRATGQPWLTRLLCAGSPLPSLNEPPSGRSPARRGRRTRSRSRSSATDRRRRAACRRPCPSDFPERLAAELEVVALLIDRVAAVRRESGCRARRRRPDRRATRFCWRGSSDTFGIAETGRRPSCAVQAAVRFLSADERRQIARRLPVDENSVLDEVPALPRHAFVVVADRRQPGRLRPVGDEIDDRRAELTLPILSGVRKLVPA